VPFVGLFCGGELFDAEPLFAAPDPFADPPCDEYEPRPPPGSGAEQPIAISVKTNQAPRTLMREPLSKRCAVRVHANRERADFGDTDFRLRRDRPSDQGMDRARSAVIA
jgi:hypothetical protein